MADEAPAADPAAPATPAEPGEPGDSADAAAPTPAAVAPTKAQQLEKDALEDATKRRAARAADIGRGKLIDQHGPALERLAKGEVRAALKELLGPRYTPELVLELAGDFKAPDEMSVEERVAEAYKTNETTRLAAEQAERQKQADAAHERADVQIDGFIDATTAYLTEHIDEYPGIEVYNVTGQEVDDLLVEHFRTTGETLDPKAVLDKLEGPKWARYQKTRFAPKPKPVGEDELDDTPVLRQPTPGVTARKLTLDEEIERDLNAHDAREREVLRRRGA